MKYTIQGIKVEQKELVLEQHIRLIEAIGDEPLDTKTFIKLAPVLIPIVLNNAEIDYLKLTTTEVGKIFSDFLALNAGGATVVLEAFGKALKS